MSLLKLCESCCGYSNTEEREMREVNGGETGHYRPAKTPWETQPKDILNLPRTMAIKDVVKMTGKISPGAKEYTINLLYDRRGTIGIGFQLKVLFDAKKVEVRSYNGSGLSPSEDADDSFGNVTQQYGEENAFSLLWEVTEERTIAISGDQSFVAEATSSSMLELRYLQVLGDIEKITSLTFEFGS